MLVWQPVRMAGGHKGLGARRCGRPGRDAAAPRPTACSRLRCRRCRRCAAIPTAAAAAAARWRQLAYMTVWYAKKKVATTCATASLCGCVPDRLFYCLTRRQPRTESLAVAGRPFPPSPPTGAAVAQCDTTPPLLHLLPPPPPTAARPVAAAATSAAGPHQRRRPLQCRPHRCRLRAAGARRAAATEHSTNRSAQRACSAKPHCPQQAARRWRGDSSSDPWHVATRERV